MTPDAVADYLKQHPEFFEEYADVLAEIFVPHPHGGHAIPISERQILTLREKKQAARGQAARNDRVRRGERRDRREAAPLDARAVRRARSRGRVSALYFNLREDFAVPHTVLRLWRTPRTRTSRVRAGSPAARDFAERLAQPYCGAHAMVDTAEWFGEAAAHLRRSRMSRCKKGRRSGCSHWRARTRSAFIPRWARCT